MPGAPYGMMQLIQWNDPRPSIESEKSARLASPSVFICVHLWLIEE